MFDNVSEPPRRLSHIKAVPNVFLYEQDIGCSDNNGEPQIILAFN